jgi:gamma-glutamyltranspeptidase / glutathione hydrolase
MKRQLEFARAAIAAGLVSALCWPAPGLADAGVHAGQAPRHIVGNYDENAIFHPAFARHGMVSSEHHLATSAGVEILRAGGNAVDAAVAVGFALAVVLPNAGNLGGGGFMLLHDARQGRQLALDFRERAPAAATAEMFLDASGEVVAGASLDTPLAVGVPGTVAGLFKAHAEHGRLPMAQLIAPAIRLAERGFTVSYELAGLLQVHRERLARWPASRAIFFKHGAPLAAGDTLVQADLARVLRQLSLHGADAFYRGGIGDRIVAELRLHGGRLAKTDLLDYRVREREPVTADYRGYRVVSMPPPSSGGVHLIQILNILSGYPMAEYGAGSSQSLHVMAEAMKLAYADRSKYLGDPDFVQVPVAALTAPGYADRLRGGIDPAQARASNTIAPGVRLPYESTQTTHYSVCDRLGNAVSVTYTLNTDFGSGIVAGGTGILLNNEMDDFSAKPGVPNAYGLVGGQANAVEAGKRPLSSMSPTMLLKDGKVYLVTGSPGGSRIITSTLQTIVNVVDHQMNPAEAASMPRIHHQWLPDELRVEKGLSNDTLALLRQKGHHVVVQPVIGKTQTIQVVADGFLGYSDPRSLDGAAAGY